jgi:hypothetical protein
LLIFVGGVRRAGSSLGAPLPFYFNSFFFRRRPFSSSGATLLRYNGLPYSPVVQL